MTLPLFPSSNSSLSDRLRDLGTEIAAQETHLDALYAEWRRLKALEARERKADPRRRLADLQPEVREMLRQEEPQAEDMRRLVPRGLAQAYTSGGVRHTTRSWTTLGLQLRRVLLEGA